MKFTLSLGIFPHHVKHCRFYTDTVYIKTIYGGSLGEEIEERKVRNGKFLYNGHLYNIPPSDGAYSFYELHAN